LLLPAADADRDFSGKWFLDARNTNARTLAAPPAPAIEVTQQAAAIHCTVPGGNGPGLQWTWLLDGRESRNKAGADTWSSKVKWEGAALLTSTIVTGAHEYSVMDRWKLSRDRSRLIVSREIVDRSGVTEGELVYVRQGPSATAAAPQEPAVGVAEAETAPPAQMQRRPEPPTAADAGYTVPAGSRVALELRNNLDTRHAHEGDHVYLEVSVPVFAGGRLAVPRGSYVSGVVTESTPAKGFKGKGQLFIRFETLTLPNGVSRDFRSRLGSADSGRGQVDPKEGGITGERDGSRDARDVAMGTGVGAGVGGMAGAASGHPLGGVGIDAAIGAAAGLATALHNRRADVVLPRGSMLEMVLDRDLTFSRDELRF
jgi:type IV secretion system protein VirB10